MFMQARPSGQQSSTSTRCWAGSTNNPSGQLMLHPSQRAMTKKKMQMSAEHICTLCTQNTVLAHRLWAVSSERKNECKCTQSVFSNGEAHVCLLHGQACGLTMHAKQERPVLILICLPCLSFLNSNLCCTGCSSRRPWATAARNGPVCSIPPGAPSGKRGGLLEIRSHYAWDTGKNHPPPGFFAAHAAQLRSVVFRQSMHVTLRNR